MHTQIFWTLYDLVLESGFAAEVAWCENTPPCASAMDFAAEHCFVVCNSGMNARVGRLLHERCWADLTALGYVRHSTFKNRNKVSAINKVYDRREQYFAEYQAADDKLTYLQTLPYIGPVIRYHLAKNLGLDCPKPDRHLERIASYYSTDTFALCLDLAGRLKLRQHTVDYVIWRAANLRIIHTEELSEPGELLVYWQGGARAESEIIARKVYWEGSGQAAGAQPAPGDPCTETAPSLTTTIH